MNKSIAIAAALAMDAFAVAIAAGVGLKRVSARHYFRLSWHFGLFQFLIPVIGWRLGEQVQVFIAPAKTPRLMLSSTRSNDGDSNGDHN